MSQLKLYKASAGSGKTFRLAVEYLKIILENPLNYKNILAVTFTNKATAEMKYRVIQELSLLEKGERTPCFKVLVGELDISEEELITRSKNCLKNILHDYSRFSISTIDSFFQRVIRSFSREIGINYPYQVDLDAEQVLDKAVHELLVSIDQDQDLLEWLKQFTRDKIQEGGGWNPRYDIKRLGRQLYNESFQELSLALYQKLNNKSFIREYRQELQEIVTNFEKTLKEIGLAGKQIIEDSGLNLSDFKYGETGPANSFNKMIRGNFEPTSRIQQIISGEKVLYKEPDRKGAGMIVEQFFPLLQEAVYYYMSHHQTYYTAKVIVNHLYTLGILVDLQEMTRRVTRDDGMVLISEASPLLRQIIADSDTPFIYEKTGVYYRHFMIDEFQDTSELQWSNFKPLIENSLSEDGKSMVVGDVKQAIYRWRGGDWNLLASGIFDDFPNHGINDFNLKKNWRSDGEIIRFNNRIFQLAPAVLQQHFDNELAKTDNAGLYPSGAIKEIYNESLQEIGRMTGQNDGYIRMKFISRVNKDEEISNEDQILYDMIEQIKLLQQKGASAAEIAILVRTKDQAKCVADRILLEKENDSPYNFNVLSGESLYVGNASSVSLILSSLKLLVNPDNQLALTKVNYLYFNEIEPILKLKGKHAAFLKEKKAEQLDLFQAENIDSDVNNFEDLKSDGNELSNFVSGEEFYREVGERNLLESVFKLTELFCLFDIQDDQAYLQAFIDQVNKFMRNPNTDISAFLTWWEEEGQEKTIAVSEEMEAIRIQTVHKAKGLEYNYVLIPFCDWELEIRGTHAPIIWCRPQQEPFNRLELVPVRYGTAMSRSLFSKEYYEEKFNNYVDQINLLYVAFTRARKALFTWSEFGDEISTVGDILLNSIMIDRHFPRENHKDITLSLYDSFDKETFVLETGIFKISSLNVNKKGVLNIKKNGFSDFKTFLKLRKNYENFFESETIEDQEVNYGKLIHEALAIIKTSNDVDKAVKIMLFKGLIDEIECIKFKVKLNELINDPKVTDWFDGTYHVMNERNILFMEHGLKRPDRIMTGNDQIVVVDYKSGAKELDKYYYQVRGYMRALKACGFQNIKGYIWYTRNNKRVEVFSA